MADVVINWTPLVDMLSGVQDIFPPLVGIMIAIVPIIFTGAVIGLVTGIFEDIVLGVRSYIRPVGR